jgi:hypothetical protein
MVGGLPEAGWLEMVENEKSPEVDEVESFSDKTLDLIGNMEGLDGRLA